MNLHPPPRALTLHKQNVFLKELLKTRNASLAAARAEVNRGSLYRWKLEDPGFAAAWTVFKATHPSRRSHKGQSEKSHPATPVVSHGTDAFFRDINEFGPAFRSRP